MFVFIATDLVLVLDSFHRLLRSTGIFRPYPKCDMRSRRLATTPILQRLANNAGRIAASRSVHVAVATAAAATIMATVATCFRYPPTRSTSLSFASSSHTILSTGVDRSSGSGLQQATEASSNLQTNGRARQTLADAYFRRHGHLPEPDERHMVLSAEDRNPNRHEASSPHGILVIGDVHGCLDELLLLHETAVRVNNNRSFDRVILVGDLCNKGPHSAAVIRHVRTNAPYWLSIRGNHDNAALTVALQEPEGKDPKKYAWVNELSDEDVQWLAQLPYTFRIPASLFNDGNGDGGTVVDTLIVRAGLIPGVPLAEQSIPTMVTLRELPQTLTVKDNSDRTEMHHDGPDAPLPSSWASHWKGPERIIFGHDAKRGLQQTDYCIGLDTGAVYGKQLTGIILPERTLVQVDSLRVYCPIQEK
jgi:bis(5'-nucleosyl)-tetraphosphatase (symmetrical)